MKQCINEMQKIMNRGGISRLEYPPGQPGVALGYGLDDRGSRVRFPAGAGNFSLRRRVRSGSVAHPAACPVGAGGSFPGGEAAEVWS